MIKKRNQYPNIVEERGKCTEETKNKQYLEVNPFIKKSNNRSKLVKRQSAK